MSEKPPQHSGNTTSTWSGRRRIAILTALLLTGGIILTIGGFDKFRTGETSQENNRVVLVGAGDIARCDEKGDEATARLLGDIPGTIFTLGDNAYEYATRSDFAKCYAPSWGRYKARTMPAAGNHEYATPGAGPYFDYFGAVAGDPDKGYYSYNRGAWHIIVLNSNCQEVGGCEPGSLQEKWLRADLKANRSECTLAYFHTPRYSSGSEHGSSLAVRPFWKALYDYRADVVLSAHDHDYERFAPQTPHGKLDHSRGIRQFVVGTGGGKLEPFGAVEPNSQVRNANTWGVLKLTLYPKSYSWKFVPVAGKTFTDSGSDRCVP